MSKLLCSTKTYKILPVRPVSISFSWLSQNCAQLFKQLSQRHNYLSKAAAATAQTFTYFVVSYEKKSPYNCKSSGANHQTYNLRRNLLLNKLKESGSRQCASPHIESLGHHCYLARHLSTFHKYQSVMDVPPGLFRGQVDRFNGIIVDSEEEFEDNDNFWDKLNKSIANWIECNRRAIWFKVHTRHSVWIPHLVKCEFKFHHVQGESLLMYRWLPRDECANIPIYAHTMIGVGGVVVNDKDEVLVVSDRFAYIPNSWKLPGGYVEPNENLINAAIREVREETGIDSEFRTVISIRHTHGGNFNCSDIYVVIGLKPKNLDLQRCEREIAKVEWMPIAEYLKHPNVHETNRHFLRTYLDYNKRGIRVTCETGIHQILKKDYCLYFVQDSDGNNAEEGNPDLPLR